MVAYVQRPLDLNGCWSSWSEQDVTGVIRTKMESGHIKTRRRFTGIHRQASVTVVLERKYYESFMLWFRDDCAGGVFPTLMMEPTGTEGVWRFVSPPSISWSAGAQVFQASCDIEQLPGWLP